MKEDLVKYLQKQIRINADRLRKHTHDISGRAYPKRFMFVRLQKYIERFMARKSDTRLVIIPGLRGVGKTTIMAQACSKIVSENKKIKTLFLSIDEVRNLFDAGINEIMDAYEEILGADLESVNEEIFIFLDEVQSDPTWAKTLKILYDKTSKIFFCCTGSSALVLQTTPDIARGRAIFERMTPLCFTEYQMIKNNVYPEKGLKKEIYEAIYFSKDAKKAAERLVCLKTAVNKYWSKVDRKDTKKFLTFASLPFTLNLPSETAIYDSISLLLDSIIKKDLPMIANFDIKTLTQAKRLLFILAENDTTSLEALDGVLSIDRLTIASLLEAFEKTELLIRIPAYGSNMSVARKPAKYLFMSPAIRMSYFSVAGPESTFLTRKGKLLEDSIGAHLYREFIVRGGGVYRYDSAQGGADFVLQPTSDKQIIIEVGLGKKGGCQVKNSMKKIKSDYGIIYSSNNLFVDNNYNIVYVPLDYYFLI